ncbi:MAG: twin-arginine translocation signal domain-containing protein [Tannerella sp.]|nr:twin-arginine translocation signal domain-containing protein [Tannerella sp.]
MTTRRSFIKRTLTAGAGFIIAPVIVPASRVWKYYACRSSPSFMYRLSSATHPMKLNRRLYWDPILERFKNDDEANAMISRPHRSPYNF